MAETTAAPNSASFLSSHPQRLVLFSHIKWKHSVISVKEFYLCVCFLTVPSLLFRKFCCSVLGTFWMVSSNAPTSFWEFFTTGFQKLLLYLQLLSYAPNFLKLFLITFIQESPQSFPGLFLLFSKNFLCAFLNPPCWFLGILSNWLVGFFQAS